MKSQFILLFLWFPVLLWSQNPQEYDRCKTTQCRILTSYNLSKYYLEVDDIHLSQKWLDKTKTLYPPNKIDTLSCSIHNLQSELFYYWGLFQFGADEAEKGIRKALEIKDSVLIADAYFFLGINAFELKKYQLAEKSFQKSFRHHPNIFQKNRLSNFIDKEHIYNNLAQTKLKINQLDSALIYNKRAYKLAKSRNGKRAIANSEQTFGEIYLSKKNLDSSKVYFEKSVQSALESEYYDIALVDYGFLAVISSNNQQDKLRYYQEGINLIREKTINAFFRRYFYELALKSFKENSLSEKIIEIQNNIIKIDDEGRLNSNSYIQDISEQYVNNEKKLLIAESEKFRKQRNITILLIITTLLCMAIMALAISFIRRKNKAQQQQDSIRLESLLDGQEKERKRIAEELHDGLNGELSAIKYHISSIKEEISGFHDKGNLQKAIEMIDQVCSQTRRISHDLMPTSIVDFGLVEAVNQYCIKINNSHPIGLEFQYFGDIVSLPKKIETTIYRIIQELINNCMKHSDANYALVQMNFHDRELFITVEDNGKGFDSENANLGLGLQNIRSRIHLLKAEMEISSNQNGSSFQISIDLTKFEK